jgi:hypothetical protein
LTIGGSELKSKKPAAIAAPQQTTWGPIAAAPNTSRPPIALELGGGPSHGGASGGGGGGGSNSSSHGGGDSSSSSHGGGGRCGDDSEHEGRGHGNNHATGNARSGNDARYRIDEIRPTKKTTNVNDNDGFPAFTARLRTLLLPKKFKPIGISKYDAKQGPIQWLRCYALAIENAGDNNDTKCLYSPFCLDQDPLTWLESLDKNSINKWD